MKGWGKSVESGGNVSWVYVADVYLHSGSSATNPSELCSGLLDSGLGGYTLLDVL